MDAKSDIKMDEILKTNPGIDPDVVASFEKIKKLLSELRVAEAGTSYKLDLPFSKKHTTQPLIRNVVKNESHVG